MKSWRCPSPSASCGRCGKLLAEDEPVLVLTMAGVQRALVRCQGCAGEAVDWQVVQAGPPRTGTGLTRQDVMQRLGEIRPGWFDARQAQAGRDE